MPLGYEALYLGLDIYQNLNWLQWEWPHLVWNIKSRCCFYEHNLQTDWLIITEVTITSLLDYDNIFGEDEWDRIMVSGNSEAVKNIAF